MTKIKQKLLIFALLVFSTCTRNLLEINASSLKNEVATKENLTFTFSNPIVADSMLNRWDTTQYVQLQPRVAGRFKWTKPNELIFSPIEGFSPSTDYSVQAGKALEKVGKTKKLPINFDQKLKFHTTYLQFEKADAFWTKNDMNTPQLRINLHFNYKVRHQNISTLISARIGEQAVQAMRVLNTEPSKVIELVMEEGGSIDLSNQPLQITMQAGIACAESDFKTTQPITHKLTSPDRKVLKIESVIATYEKEKPVLKVRTSQNIGFEQLKQHFKIEPRLVYEVFPAEGGFLVKGFFKRGEMYNIKFAQHIEGSLGARLGGDHEQMVTFKEEEPYVQFSEDKGTYLSNAGSRNVGLRTHGVPRIHVKIYKVYENNLQHFLREMGGYRDYYGRGGYEYGLENYADVIFEREMETKKMPLVNGSQILTLDNEKLKGNKGLFYVSVTSTENQWLKDSKLISLSDIGFIVRETKEDILVFTNSLLNTQPLKNLPVQIISKSNQIIAAQTTDEQGVTVFKHIKRKFPKADVQLITAQGTNDYNFIYLNGTGIDKSDFETGGKYETESGYQAYMYGERNLYRPGETININSIVCSRDWQPVVGMPVVFRLSMPNGKQYTALKGTLNAQGSYSTSIKLPANAMTGTYTARIETTTGENLESMQISVEEFMPDRIKVLMSFLDKDLKKDKVGEIVPDDSLRVLLKARNLFGPPAAGKNFQMSFSLRSEEFEPKAFSNYTFALDRRGENGDYFNPENYLTQKETEGKTDEKGNFYQAFHLPKTLENHGILYGYVYSTVFDETGRGVSRTRGFNVITQPYMVGLKRGLYYAVPNEPMNIELIAVKADETATTGKAKVQIYQYKWQNTLERNPNSEEMRYVSQRKLEKVADQLIDINTSGAVVNFTPKEVGEYEIRVALPESETYLKQRFYVYTPAYVGGGNRKNDAFPIDKKGKVEIKLDKNTYQIGSQAKVLFTTPFNGKMLVTVERYGVYTHQYVEVKNRTASIVIDVKKEYLPNVYVTATLIKPSTDGVIPMTVAHGFANLAVDEPSTHLDIKIEAVERTQTHQKQTVKVVVKSPLTPGGETNSPSGGWGASGAEVTLAIVDEGILQIKNYETPNAHKEFYTKRALEVNSYNIYPRLFPEIAISRSSVGGDGFELAGRTNPVVNKRVKLVSFWSGTLQTNAAGEAYFTIDIPQFSGSLRIMALAYKDGAFGHSEKNMIVADPIVVSTGFPRFLAPQDRVTVPVTVFNTTKENITTQISISTTNALHVKGKANQEIELKAGSEDDVKFEVEAKNLIDSAKVVISVLGAGKTFTEELFVNIRPITGFVKHFGTGSIEAGKQITVNFPDDLVPSAAKGRLVVSKSPLIQFANNFEYLVQYPHGCVEQITSGAFPQLYVQDLLRVISPEKQNLDILQAQARFYIQEAIYKLQSLQTYSGGLSYWSGNSEAHSFGSVYAAHFLLEAQKLGYQVDQTLLDAMLGFLKNLSDNDVDYEYVFTDDKGKRWKKKIARRENIYALYVLTLANRENLPVMNYYKENPAQMSLDSKYLLASAFQLLGDQASAKAVLPTQFAGEREDFGFNNSFSSPLRDEALALNALIEADENDLQIPTMARHLTDAVRNASYLNTQENAFILLSLGKLARKTADSQAMAQVTRGGAPVANGADVMLMQDVLGKAFQIQASNGTLYYYWQAQGLSASGKVENIDHKIKVRRAFYDKEGNVIKNNIFRQNDLVIVKISIVTDNFIGEVPNIAITDLLPAGLEIENPRLTASKEIPWIRNRASADYIDMRDDRINIFTSATKEVKNFYYLTRAVTIGSYNVGTLSADAMYNGEFRSYYGGGLVHIVERNSENK
jgi:hypothetical protein